MNARPLLLFGFAILASGILLLQSYKEFKAIIETLMSVMALTTVFIAVYDFLRHR